VCQELCDFLIMVNKEFKHHYGDYSTEFIQGCAHFIEFKVGKTKITAIIKENGYTTMQDEEV